MHEQVSHTGTIFAGFSVETFALSESSLYVRYGGNGPGVLLLHGHPRTGATWHRVTPRLVEAGCSVVVPDLRGYGRSRGPAPTVDHSAHSKRAVAGDMAELMTRLGHETFTVVGHDRGSYVALRLALDHEHRVTRSVLIDCVPISEHLRRADAALATAWWHWFFYAQPEVPERVITAGPEAWYSGDPEEMGRENHAERRQAINDPAVVRAMLEDYRAGLTIDRAHEEADRSAGRRLQNALLVLWSQRDDLEALYGNPLQLWEDWAEDVTGRGIDSGHHVAEEAPEALSAAILPLLAD